jgi:hypothetical protein
MRIFLSYASPDKSDAESIAFALRSRRYLVFLDRDDLPAGRSYDEQIERAVEKSQIFIFLVSPNSVAEGGYALTELLFARKKWKNPSGRVLPIMVRKTPLDKVPPYLKAVTILEPTGNIAAETSAAVDDLWKASRKLVIAFQTLFVVAASLAAVLAWVYMRGSSVSSSSGSGPAPIKCKEEGTLRSLEGNVQTTVAFTNKGSQPIRVYWLDYAGKRIPYGTFGTNQVFSTQTYVTHPWLIADAKDNCRAIYMPTPERLEVSVGD